MANILLVDDDERLLELGKIFMEEEGHHNVITSNSVDQALRHVGVVPIDVIVSDYQMPEVTGIEFLSTIRGRKERIPFILFTGKGREEIVIEAINRGADYYIKKDTDVRSQYAQLLHTIDQALMRKEAEDAVDHNLNLFKQLIENNMDLIIVLDEDKNIEYVSPSIWRLTGYYDNEVIGHLGYEFVNPEMIDSIMRVDVNDPGTFSSRWIIFDIKKKDGSWITIEAIAKLFDRSGQKKIIINARDITERMEKDKQLEFLAKEIGVHQSDLEKISQPGLVGGVDFEFSTNRINLTPVASKIFGLDGCDVKIDQSIILKMVHPDDISMVQDGTRYLVKSEEPLEKRYRIVLPSGEIKHISSVTCVKIGDDGNPKSIQGIVRDCTEVVHLQEKIMAISKRR